MRIAYVCYWDLAGIGGVAAKIRSQLAAWREAGHEAEAFAVAPDRLARRLARTQAAAEGVRRFRPDLVYVRYDLYLPPVWRVVRGQRAAVEVNTDDQAEARLRPRRPRLASFFNELNRRNVLGPAAGFVAVTHELARGPGVARFRKPTEVIANGIDLDAVRPLPAPRNDAPTLVFLGSARQRWHGVDKIALLAERMPEARFEVIGYRPEFVDFPVLPNMTVHPRLDRQAYEPILARADVALGTLALHRKRMQEACPLKVREYLAYGLPVVIGYDDTDFLGADPWYLLRLPNEEGNVRDGVDAIRAFLERVRGRRVARDEVAGRIGAAEKERGRLAFLERLAQSPSAAR